MWKTLEFLFISGFADCGKLCGKCEKLFYNLFINLLTNTFLYAILHIQSNETSLKIDKGDKLNGYQNYDRA